MILASTAVKNEQLALMCIGSGFDVLLILSAIKSGRCKSYVIWNVKPPSLELIEPANLGHFIIATFADDGSMKCSGLEVERYGIGKLTRTLGPNFKLQSRLREAHERLSTLGRISFTLTFGWYK